EVPGVIDLDQAGRRRAGRGDGAIVRPDPDRAAVEPEDGAVDGEDARVGQPELAGDRRRGSRPVEPDRRTGRTQRAVLERDVPGPPGPPRDLAAVERAGVGEDRRWPLRPPGAGPSRLDEDRRLVPIVERSAPGVAERATAQVQLGILAA